MSQMIRSLLFLLPLFSSIVVAQQNLRKGDFFRKIYKAHPHTYFPLHHQGSHAYYAERTAGDGMIMEHSFLPLRKPGKKDSSSYLQTISNDTLTRLFPGAVFYYGELTCNQEFNGGRLPFIGYQDRLHAFVVPQPSYSGRNKKFIQHISQTTFAHQEDAVLACDQLAKIFFRLHLYTSINCKEHITQLRQHHSITGDTLTVRFAYHQLCWNMEENGEPHKWEDWQQETKMFFLLKENHIADWWFEKYW